MNYLAIDFGTSNCLAAEITPDLKLSLATLENGKSILPSAIFLKRRSSRSRGIDLIRYEENVGFYLSKELSIIEEFENSVQSQLADYRKLYGPKLMDPNESYSASQIARRNLVAPHELVNAMAIFDNKVADKERRLREYMPSVRNEAQIRLDVELKMYQDLINQDIDLLKTETFFSALEDRNCEVLFGQEAIDQYKADPFSGFFMRSPKAFLAAVAVPAHIELYTKVVTLVISKIKQKSESTFQKTFSGVVIGHPVNFMGAFDESANSRALDILNQAAMRAGFKKIRFVHEPLAASLVVARSMYSNSEPAIIVDIGGGTTDIAYLKVSPDSDVKLEVIQLSGSRVGGSDFDQSIARQSTREFLGNSDLMCGQILTNLYSTRDIYKQAAFRNSGNDILKLINKFPEEPNFRRLFHVYREQLQHELMISGEEIKIALASSNLVTKTFDYLNPVCSTTVESSSLDSICTAELASIAKLLKAVIPKGSENLPVRVFMTGGMSSFPPIYKVIRENVPKGSIFKRVSALESVVAGLAVVARQLDLSQGQGYEPTSVRGVPVRKLDL